MSRIENAFKNKKAFIPFITCGDPDIATTQEVVKEAIKNGADLIELGIPFSDPTAEGPVIQEASLRALNGGMTTDKAFSLAESIRKTTDVPLVFMTYANVVFSYGGDKFMSRCKEVGVDGIILPDLPFEEKEEFLSVCKKYDIALISLIAPTSQDRIEMIAKEAEGFIYLVSSLGVTGERSKITTDIDQIVKAIKNVTNVPCAVGFGISNPEQAGRMAAMADGVIVGSAIVKKIAQYGKDSAKEVGNFVSQLSTAVHNANR
ncbi:MAG TPA: tryptophan synthase subunit alpha [Lachnospiraceae bacterium]|nr:tryptophan synthase subunit alpha [Lachnospiraceae bacterium]